MIKKNISLEPLTKAERDIVDRLTIEQKIGVCNGNNPNENLGIVYTGRKKVAQGYRFHFQNYPFYRLIYTISGVLKVYHKEGTYLAESGTIVSFKPGESCEIQSISAEPWVHAYVHFTGQNAPRLYKESQLKSKCIAIPTDPLEVQQIFENIVNESIRQNKHSQEICNQYLQILLRKLSDQQLQNHPHFGTSKTIYLECRNYINENFNDLLGICQVADEFHINCEYLCRLFKKYATISPMAYILQLKMNRAAILLMQTDFSIKKISFMLNFSDPYYFSRVFKKNYGISPSLYREHRQ